MESSAASLLVGEDTDEPVRVTAPATSPCSPGRGDPECQRAAQTSENSCIGGFLVFHMCMDLPEKFGVPSHQKALLEVVGPQGPGRWEQPCRQPGPVSERFLCKK